MERRGSRAALILIAACTSALAAPKVDVKAEVAQLADAKQDVRDAAAKRIRDALAADPKASGDPGEAAWKKKLAAAKPGLTEKKFAELFHATNEGGASSGQSSTLIFRLDDYWVVETYFDLPDSLRELGPLEHRARSVWVEPPADYSGHWVTYFVNGRVEHDIEYDHRKYVTFTSYYENGQLASQQHYTAGKITGEEIGYHDNGKKAYVGHHADGKQTGHWTHWYPDGKVESEMDYVAGQLDGTRMQYRANGTKEVMFEYTHGKETGQAAWDEHGTLQYAHGTAEKHVH